MRPATPWGESSLLTILAGHSNLIDTTLSVAAIAALDHWSGGWIIPNVVRDLQDTGDKQTTIGSSRSTTASRPSPRRTGRSPFPAAARRPSRPTVRPFPREPTAAASSRSTPTQSPAARQCSMAAPATPRRSPSGWRRPRYPAWRNRPAFRGSEATIHILHPFTYVLMKLAAFHAMDLYRTVALLTEPEHERALELLAKHEQLSTVRHARSIASEDIASSNAIGILRLREHALYQPDFPLIEFMRELHGLLGMPLLD